MERHFSHQTRFQGSKCIKMRINVALPPVQLDLSGHFDAGEERGKRKEGRKKGKEWKRCRCLLVFSL